LAEVLREPAVSLGDDRLEVTDLVLLGVITGEWAEFESRVREGLACERDRGEQVGNDEVQAAATAFRYARRLISAADFTGWLHARRLTVAAVSAVLRRSLLRERFGAPAGVEITDAELATVLWPEALCDGILAALAEQGIGLLVAGERAEATDGSVVDSHGSARALRQHATAIASLGEHEVRSRLARLERLRRAQQHLRQELAVPALLQRKLAEHGLGWISLTGAQFCFDTEGAAREARMLLAEDGMDTDAVGARANTSARRRSLLIEELPAEVRGTFASHMAGEVVGPWAQDQQWHVMKLVAKASASLDDPVLRQRAIDELLRETTERHAAGRVRRHCAL
jgi:hypothetical protein